MEPSIEEWTGRAADASLRSPVSPTVSVVVPSYRRPSHLERCLSGLSEQERVPDEVAVIVRPSDSETVALLAEWHGRDLPIRCVHVLHEGVIAALNVALKCYTSDIFAVIDDDAVPQPDWITRLIAHYLSETDIGGVGGLDLVHLTGGILLPNRRTVGRVRWYGRTVGNHHLGLGAPRDVDMLKGVNMSYRREAIGDLKFDRRLVGNGAQVGYELGFGLAIKSKGYRLLYDPMVVVHHYPGVRTAGDDRIAFDPERHSERVFNTALILSEYFLSKPFAGVRLLAYIAYLGVFGTRDAPGLAHIIWGIVTAVPDVLSRTGATWRAYVQVARSIFEHCEAVETELKVNHPKAE